MSDKIAGRVTPEGTTRFAKRFEMKVAPSHFRIDHNGLTLTSLGMGSYLGEADSQTDQEMTEAVIASVEAGAINVLDTAINYRYQSSERSYGNALRHLIATGAAQRDEIFIATKNGFLTPDAAINEEFRSYFEKTFIKTGIVDPKDIAGGIHCMSPSYLEHQLNQSLDNLGIETLDLMYLHNAAESQLTEVGRDVFMERLKAAFEFYESARKAGKLQFYGMATWDCFRVDKHREDEYLNLETIVELAELVGGKGTHGFRYVQLPYNFAMMEALSLPVQRYNGEPASLLQAAINLEVGVFTSVPLLQGQLLQHQLPQFEGLATPAQWCIQFVRSTPGILAPLIGQKQKRHVTENLKVAEVSPLDIEAFDTLFAAAK